MDERRAHAKAYRQKARQIIREFMAMAETYMDALTDLAEDAAESQFQPSGHARAPPTSDRYASTKEPSRTRRSPDQEDSSTRGSPAPTRSTGSPARTVNPVNPAPIVNPAIVPPDQKVCLRCFRNWRTHVAAEEDIPDCLFLDGRRQKKCQYCSKGRSPCEIIPPRRTKAVLARRQRMEEAARVGPEHVYCEAQRDFRDAYWQLYRDLKQRPLEQDDRKRKASGEPEIISERTLGFGGAPNIPQNGGSE